MRGLWAGPATIFFEIDVSSQPVAYEINEPADVLALWRVRAVRWEETTDRPPGVEVRVEVVGASRDLWLDYPHLRNRVSRRSINHDDFESRKARPERLDPAPPVSRADHWDHEAELWIPPVHRLLIPLKHQDSPSVLGTHVKAFRRSGQPAGGGGGRDDYLGCVRARTRDHCLGRAYRAAQTTSHRDQRADFRRDPAHVRNSGPRRSCSSLMLLCMGVR